METSLTRRLIYYMWIPENLDPNENLCYKFHLTLLKRYADVFTTATFYLAYDVYDKELLTRVERNIVNLGWSGDVSFVLRKNNKHYREVEVFYNDIYKKLDDLDDLTMFAHSKGMTNVNPEYLETDDSTRNDSIDREAVYRWIFGMYWFNLEYVKNVANYLIENQSLIWGAYPCYDAIYNKWMFPGTFYWMNCRHIAEFIKTRNIEIRKYNRFFAEAFPSMLVPCDFDYISAHNNIYSVYEYGLDMYHMDQVEMCERNSFQCDEPEIYERFLETYDNMMTEAKNTVFD